ncbi:MAG: phosphoribosylamine--glycine ligase [Candidatus Omnitrophota bacterium]
MGIKVLVVGSGGREHALSWKIARSDAVDKIFCAPGNAGTAETAENVNIKADDINGLLSFAKDERIDLTCVGPEAPLVAGIADIFSQNGLKVFGPSGKAAMLEGSKAYAKAMMRKYGISTADFEVFDNAEKAKEYVRKKGAAFVIKADGLAAGKGVTVCGSAREAENAIEEALCKKAFGSAGARIIVEEALSGEEASILAVSDGKNRIILDSSQDHKRVFDNDKGPNTGGMGAYSPAPVITGDMLDRIAREVIDPLLEGMKKEGNPYKGVIYAGVMITEDGPKVLEFNARFGDPETQALLPRLKTDLVRLMLASVNGDIGGMTVEWDPRPCVSVVMTSEGYPGPYEKGKAISGLDFFKDKKDIMVFHAGTRKDGAGVVTDGGRVLNVTGMGETVGDAIDAVYRACGRIKFDGAHYRHDIGYRALRAGAGARDRKN